MGISVFNVSGINHHLFSTRVVSKPQCFTGCLSPHWFQSNRWVSAQPQSRVVDKVAGTGSAGPWREMLREGKEAKSHVKRQRAEAITIGIAFCDHPMGGFTVDFLASNQVQERCRFDTVDRLKFWVWGNLMRSHNFNFE
jgi:hypothetical protein